MNGEQKKQIINSPVCNVTHFDGEDDKWRCWYTPRKLVACWKQFGTGSIDGHVLKHENFLHDIIEGTMMG